MPFPAVCRIAEGEAVAYSYLVRVVVVLLVVVAIVVVVVLLLLLLLLCGGCGGGFAAVHLATLASFRAAADLEGGQHFIASTQMEADYARQALPCFDEPALKVSHAALPTPQVLRLALQRLCRC